jgi:hypothetical protein
MQMERGLQEGNKMVLRAAFRSHVQSVAFFLFVLALLVLPWGLMKSGKIPPRSVYAAMPQQAGDFAFLARQTFDETSDIDILFLGSSMLWTGVDAPLVQHCLEATCGHKVQVLTFGVNYRDSLDEQFVLLRNLLGHRRVKMLVFSLPLFAGADKQVVPSPPGSYFLRMGDGFFSRFPLLSRVSLYSAYVLQAPRDLLSLARPGRMNDIPDVSGSLGFYSRRLGWNRVESLFRRVSFPPPDIDPGATMFREKHDPGIKVRSNSITPYQQFFLDRIHLLSEQYRTFLVFLHLPALVEKDCRQVEEVADWPALYGSPLIGVAGSRVFRGLKEKDLLLLYYDENHFNVNGAEYYTRAIAPTLVEVYEKSVEPRRRTGG